MKGCKGTWASSDSSEAEGPDEMATPSSEQGEFISDAIKSDEDANEDVQKGMRQLGVAKQSSKSEELGERINLRPPLRIMP